MNDQSDPEVTPRPLRLTKNADVADRTPYIPRRKSSVGERYGSRCRDVSTKMALEQPQKPLHIWPKHHISTKKSLMFKEERRSSKASLSRVNSPPDTYNATFAQSHQGLSYHDRTSISSSESRSRRRLFSRIMSSFTNNNNNNNNSTQAISNLAKFIGLEQEPDPRLSGSTAGDSSSRANSTASTESRETSLVRFDPSRTPSTNKPSSSNPLDAPPVCLIRRENSQYLALDHRIPSTSIMPDEEPPPALATATLLCTSSVTTADLEKPTTVWIAIDIECSIYFSPDQDSTSPLRSKALGPPPTDPGFLSNLSLSLAPTSGCTTILRLLGSDSRDFLFPGETWSLVAQVLADPPPPPPASRRNKAVKAFSLHTRPSSHALMDQLHSMLSPPASSPTSQDLIQLTLTFEHALLPANVQCSVTEKMSLERLSPPSTWSLDYSSSTSSSSSRPQYLRHRHYGQQQSPPRKTTQQGRGREVPSMNAKTRQQRDFIAGRLFDLLESDLDSWQTSTTTNRGHAEATEILEDFFDGFEASSPRLQQRATDLLHALELKLRPLSRPPTRAGSPEKRRRRNGFELSRGERGGVGLVDITNRYPRTAAIGSRPGRPRDVITPAPVVLVSAAPAPLFSPRKRASAKNLGAGEGPDVGSPRFYEDEVDEARRIWRGMRDSSTGTCGVGEYLGAGGAGEGRADGDGEENGSAVLGAPWL